MESKEADKLMLVGESGLVTAGRVMMGEVGRSVGGGGVKRGLVRVTWG